MGELIRPKGFRHTWVNLGAPFAPNRMNDGEDGSEDMVFIKFYHPILTPLPN